MLSHDDYRQVARLHQQAISEGFLSSLGVNFLALLYEAIDRSGSSVLLVVREGERVVGFVSGAPGLREVYRYLLSSWFRLGVALIPSLFSPRKVFRILETFAFSRKADSNLIDLPRDELLSIAVEQSFRGKGHAERIFRDLQRHFRTIGVRQFKIVVGDELLPAHRFYCRMGARPVAQAEVHKGSGSVIYVCDVK